MSYEPDRVQRHLDLWSRHVLRPGGVEQMQRHDGPDLSQRWAQIIRHAGRWCMWAHIYLTCPSYSVTLTGVT